MKCNMKSRICERYNAMTRRMQRCSKACHKMQAIATGKHIHCRTQSLALT
jgi:hypothetical protein